MESTTHGQKTVKIEGMEELVRIMYNIGIEISKIYQTLEMIKDEMRIVASSGL